MRFNIEKQNLLNDAEIKQLNIEWCLEDPTNNLFNIPIIDDKFFTEISGWIFTKSPGQLILRNSENKVTELDYNIRRPDVINHLCSMEIITDSDQIGFQHTIDFDTNELDIGIRIDSNEVWLVKLLKTIINWPSSIVFPVKQYDYEIPKFYLSDGVNISEAKVSKELITSHTSMEIGLHKQDDLFVHTGSYFCTSASTGFLAESSYLLDPRDFRKKLSMTKEFVNFSNCKAYLIGNKDYHNYYHWLLQVFGAILVLKYYDKDFHNYKIIVPPLNKWRKQFLDIYQIDNYVEVGEDKLLFFNDVSFSNIMWGLGAFRPNADFLSLYSKFCQLSSNVSKFCNKIYISRSDTKKRKALNENELLNFLEKYGFDIVTLSDISVEEQINAFRHADVIIAEHGAGLSNLVFARPGAVVIELLQEDYLNFCFQVIASSLNLRYSCLINKVIVSGSADIHNLKYVIDIPKLTFILAEALK